jgi:hypothetical protein
MDLAGVIVNGTSGASDMGSTLVLLIYRSPSAVSTPPGNSVSISSN